MSGDPVRDTPSPPALSPIQADEVADDHVLLDASNMAAGSSGLTLSDVSGQGRISPLPILERIEAEVAAELLAQLETQPGPSQDIPCGQLLHASPVHDPESDGNTGKVNVHAVGSDVSPTRNSSSEFSQSLLSEPKPRASTAEKAQRGRKNAGTARKPTKTNKQPRETAARKTELIRAQVEQNQAKLDSMSSSVDKIHHSLSLVTSQLQSIAQQQTQAAKSHSQRSHSSHGASHKSRSSRDSASSDNKHSSSQRAKSAEQAKPATRDSGTEQHEATQKVREKPRNETSGDKHADSSQASGRSATESVNSAKTAPGHSSGAKFPKKSSENKKDLPVPATRESRLDIFNRALKAARDREAAAEAAKHTESAKRALSARETFQPRQVEHGPDLISRDPRLQARRHPAQHYLRTADETREYVERTLGISTRPNVQQQPRAPSEVRRTTNDYTRDSMQNAEANVQNGTKQPEQSRDMLPPPTKPKPIVGPSSGASTSSMKGYGRNRSVSGWRPDLPTPKPVRLQSNYVDPRSGNPRNMHDMSPSSMQMQVVDDDDDYDYDEEEEGGGGGL